MKFFIFCILHIIITVSCFAQQQYTFTTYSEEQGLPSGSINMMFKDANGFLWIWGARSIARFDGYNFKIFRHNPDDTTSLPNNTIINAYGIPNGDIYINFESASRRFYDPKKSSFTEQTVYSGSLGLQETGIAQFYFTLKRDINALYFGLGNKLVRISNGVSEYVSMPRHVIQAVCDSTDFLLLNDAGKVFVFRPDEKIFDQIPVYDRSGRPDTTVYEIYYSEEEKNYIALSKKHFYRFRKNEDRFIPGFDLHQSCFGGQLYRNKYFACMSGGKLYKLNIQTGEEKIIHLNKKIPENEVKNNAIIGGVLDNKGLLWIKSHSMGLFRYDINTDRYDQFINDPGNPASIPSNAIHYVYPDEEGMAWILCLGVGLVKIEPVVHVMERLNPAPSNKENVIWDETKNIRTFLETSSGYLVGSLGGLYNYDTAKKEFSELTGMIGPGQRIIGAMARDESGNTWVGTWEGQLSILHPQNNRSISPEVPFRKFRVRDLICDHKNTIWIATEGGGIYTVNANDINFDNPASLQFNHVSHEEKNASNISSGIVFTLTEDADGTIWAGADKGLNQYDRTSKKWTRYSHIPGDAHSLHGDDVRSLAFDKKGSLWIGTNGGGLNRYNKAENTFTHFTMANGLTDDAVYTILCDNNGMLWLGTNRGLCRFNPEDYTCKNFTMKDGIQNYEFNTEAALKLKDGRLLFGGADGYNVIDPAKNTKRLPPAVVISAIKIFDREVPPGDGHLKLKYTENSLTFEFAALSFYRNQDNHYAYKMEGIDPDWIYSNNRRFVTYSNLEPADYIFKVKACNSDGVWNETGTQLAINIMPPWWKTWWASAGFLLLVVSGVVWFYKNRTASLHKQKRILESTVEQRTSDLREQKEIAEHLVDEKVMLMKEMHHRVKNNLEVINSLLELQSEGIVDVEAKAAVIAGQGRVQSIALIHHKLYRTDEVSSVEFKSFANDLYKQVAGVFKKPGTEVNFKILSDETQMATDVAVPIGLILNELFTNTFKYAVSDAQSNTISIHLQPGVNGVQSKIIYSDNGPGMPEHFDLSTSSSLGMKVIQLLTRQLGGTLSFHNTNGSVFEIPFNNNHKN